jgi:hypothetical protein
LANYLEKNHLLPSKLEVRKVPHLLNYSFQVIDNRYVILSLFEMYRDKHASAPAFALDLEKSSELAKFFQKELQGLFACKAI